jgi:2-succinyl-6-hydroxy-2,4-cyclohexadiene-1-carboxylate synthase
MYENLAEISGISIAAPDLPGHGLSTIEPISMRGAVDAIADLLATFDEPPVLLGYSQGGRVGLQVALTYPVRVGALVLVATSPGLDDRARKLRRVADEGLASRIERIGLERFITEWLANPLVATDHVARELREADRAIRLDNTAEGLAAALLGMGQASVANSLQRIPGLPMRTVFIAGANDDHYAEHATTMAASRNGRPQLVEGAGHNVVLEAPETIAATLSGLLRTG